MYQIKRNALSIFWISLIEYIINTEGNQLYQDGFACLSDSNFLRLPCPDDHIVLISRAEYRRSVQACTPARAVDCTLLDVTQEIHDVFNLALGAVDIPLLHRLSRLPGCNTTGHVYFYVSYKCEASMLHAPERALALSLCSSAEYHGSLVYLWNPSFPLASTEATCRCTLTTRQGVRIYTRLTMLDSLSQGQSPVMTLSSPEQGHMQLTSDDVSNRLVEFAPEGLMSLVYNNTDSLPARYMLVVEVNYLENLTVVCGDRDAKEDMHLSTETIHSFSTTEMNVINNNRNTETTLSRNITDSITPANNINDDGTANAINTDNGTMSVNNTSDNGTTSMNNISANVTTSMNNISANRTTSVNYIEDMITVVDDNTYHNGTSIEENDGITVMTETGFWTKEVFSIIAGCILIALAVLLGLFVSKCALRKRKLSDKIQAVTAINDIYYDAYKPSESSAQVNTDPVYCVIDKTNTNRRVTDSTKTNDPISKNKADLTRSDPDELAVDDDGYLTIHTMVKKTGGDAVIPSSKPNNVAIRKNRPLFSIPEEVRKSYEDRASGSCV